MTRSGVWYLGHYSAFEWSDEVQGTFPLRYCWPPLRGRHELMLPFARCRLCSERSARYPSLCLRKSFFLQLLRTLELSSRS
jgi:hypothetical protein